MGATAFEGRESQLAEAVVGLGEPSNDAYLWGDWRGTVAGTMA